MRMCSYYLWVGHVHQHLLLLSKAWSWAVITYEFRMSISTDYSWVTHEYEQLLVMSFASACAVITLD